MHKFTSSYTVSIVIEMLLVDLNYNFEFDWFVELPDNNLASELVGNRIFFKPITIEEIK